MKRLLLIMIIAVAVMSCKKENVNPGEEIQPETKTEYAYTIECAKGYEFTAYFESIKSQVEVAGTKTIQKQFDEGLEKIVIKSSAKGANFVIKYKGTSVAIYRSKPCTLLVNFYSFIENGKKYYRISIKDN